MQNTIEIAAKDKIARKCSINQFLLLGLTKSVGNLGPLPPDEKLGNKSSYSVWKTLTWYWAEGGDLLSNVTYNETQVHQHTPDSEQASIVTTRLSAKNVPVLSLIFLQDNDWLQKATLRKTLEHPHHSPDFSPYHYYMCGRCKEELSGGYYDAKMWKFFQNRQFGGNMYLIEDNIEK